jgi:hypothetical protein
MSSKLYQIGNAGQDGTINSLVAKVQHAVNRSGPHIEKRLASSVVAMESLDATTQLELEGSVKGLKTSLESISSQFAAELNANDGLIKGKHTVAQKQAGLVAAIVAGDMAGFLKAPVARKVSLEGHTFIPAMGNGAMDHRQSKALEAYDERETKSATVYSVAYNLQAARQDEFGEAFFPTVVVTPDQYGYTVSIRLVQVYDEVRRTIDGALSKNFGKKNIIQALIDPTILRNDLSKIVPVYRPESAANFVATSLVPAADIEHEGVSIKTAPLAIGKSFSLLGISQTDALLETGMLDSTDAIDPAIKLSSLYLQVGSGGSAEVIKFKSVANMQSGTFTYSVQNNYRLMTLNFISNALVLNVNTKKADGSASTVLAPIVQGNYEVKLSVQVFGNVNLELADTQLSAGQVSIYEIRDEDGNIVDPTTGAGATIATALAGASIVGYDLDARRTNTNRRERGQLLDLTFYNMVYGVPLLSPITIPRPLTLGDQNDASDLAALITATHIRTSNAAVAKLLDVETALKELVTANGGLYQGDPEILGVARFLVTPFYEHQDYSAPAVVDSIKSHERAADIQASLINILRDMAYRMYRDSGYKAAADALAGGIAATPTVIIGTDPVIARYLQVTGDFRTLGNDFNVKIVSTLNINMRGKIRMSFGEFGEGKEGVPNPMHFGNMAWKPELTLILPLHRNGANSKEITVQPSFLHVVNLPIMGSIDVSGIEDVVTAKVAVNMHTVS